MFNGLIFNVNYKKESFFIYMLVDFRNVSNDNYTRKYDFAHRSYMIKYKQMTVLVLGALVATGNNVGAACKCANIHHSLFYKWKEPMEREKQASQSKTSDSRKHQYPLKHLLLVLCL